MRFILLVHEPVDSEAGGPPEALADAMSAFRADPADGHIVDDGGLMPRRSDALLRIDAGRVSTVDGPFAEAKEVVGGFFVVESPSAKAMGRWTRAFAEMHAVHWPHLSFVAEVRQIADGPNG